MKENYDDLENIKQWLIETKSLNIPRDTYLLVINGFQNIYEQIKNVYYNRNLINSFEMLLNMTALHYGPITGKNNTYIFDYEFIVKNGEMLINSVLNVNDGLYWTNKKSDGCPYEYVCWSSIDNSIVNVAYDDSCFYFIRG